MLQQSQRYRNILIQDPLSSTETLINQQRIIQFSSNDYLGFSQESKIKAAAVEALNKYGIGSTGSRLITGTTPLIQDLEKDFAKLKQVEASLFFNSGYNANIAAISTLMGPNDVIFYDELCHSSLLSGAKLSQAKTILIEHLNNQDLKTQLSRHRKDYRNALFITESIFSMDGDKADLKEINKLCKKNSTWLMVDEAHSTGLWGEKGSGIINSLGLNEDVDIQVATCSKALGVQGGFVNGSKELISFLKQRSSSFIYSTAPSPAVVGAVKESIKLCKQSEKRRTKLFQNAELIKAFCKDLGLQMVSTDSQIICIEISSIENVIKASETLMNGGVWVQAIRPPTVKTPRLRIVPNALHSPEQLEILFKNLKLVKPFVQ
ncbi:MAG TPA: pyridoxal phosphate-dependent aminotransferase family protein [Vampirovibrionales bacterium]